MAVTTGAPSNSKRTVVRQLLTRQEWARAGGMFGFIIALHVIGFTLLLIGAAHHYQIVGLVRVRNGREIDALRVAELVGRLEGTGVIASHAGSRRRIIIL